MPSIEEELHRLRLKSFERGGLTDVETKQYSELVQLQFEDARERSILEFLEVINLARFRLLENNTALEVFELCDGATSCDLDKVEVSRLIAELQALFDRMIEND